MSKFSYSLISILVFVMVGCHAAILPLQIREGDVIQTELIIENNSLVFNDFKIDNWKVDLPACENCLSAYDRFDTPQGPEKTIKIYNPTDTFKILIVESKQGYKKVDDWSFRFVDESALQVCNTGKCDDINHDGYSTLAGCEVYVPWAKLLPSKNNYSNSPRHHFQVIISCIRHTANID